MNRFHTAYALLGVTLIAGCGLGNPEGNFISGRDEMLCSDVLPQCQGKAGGCVLDENHYITGAFPGTRKFLVETSQGDWIIKVLVFIEDRLSPGSETEVHWYEPGCKDHYKYQLTTDSTSAGDLFEQAGKTQVFAKEHVVTEDGDHLIEVYSDATCRYAIRVELRKKQ
jgi:hypothetical protein